MKKLLLLALFLPAPALAQEAPLPRITVSGDAIVLTMPDRAVLTYSVHGEGATSDEAVAAMVATRNAIDAGIGTYVARASITVSQVAIGEVRERDCQRSRNTTGLCPIVGYTADLTFEIRTPAVKDGGTIVGLIGRLGGTSPRLNRFLLADDRPAQARALTAALADARRQAEAIAAGMNVRLGRLLNISNGSNFQRLGDDIGQPIVQRAAPAPPPPVISIDLTLRPIETPSRVTAVWEIAS